MPELATTGDRTPDAKPDVRVRLAGSARGRRTPTRWFASRRTPTGRLWLRCGRHAAGYLLRFPGVADFAVDARGREVVAVPRQATPRHALRHLLLDQVLPLVLNLRGREALHATAVLTPGGVCAFVGPAGAGKSTLAASFLLAGHPLLSDDCLVLHDDRGSILAGPACPGLRLWEDSLAVLGGPPPGWFAVAGYASKRRLAPRPSPAPAVTGRHPVRRIYAVARTADPGTAAGVAPPVIEPLSRREGFMELVRSAFRLDTTDGAMLVRQFRVLERLAGQAPVARLWLPDRLAALPAARAAVLADLARA